MKPAKRPPSSIRFGADSKLDEWEQAMVITNHRDLLERGVKEPLATRMAFEFAACQMRAATRKDGAGDE